MSKTEHVLPPFQVLNTRSRGQGLFDGTPYLPHYKSHHFDQTAINPAGHLLRCVSHGEVLTLSPAALLIYLTIYHTHTHHPPPQKRK